MKSFHCTCGNILFFESSRCLRCGFEVGFDPIQNTMRVIDRSLKRCANGVEHAVCNWLLPISSTEALCASCCLNRTIPDLASRRNQQHWSLMEAAKRRLLHTLNALGIPLHTVAEDPQNGLAFDIVSTLLNPAMTTGHLNGVITVSLEEADDTWRQINRQQLGKLRARYSATFVMKAATTCGSVTSRGCTGSTPPASLFEKSLATTPTTTAGLSIATTNKVHRQTGRRITFPPTLPLIHGRTGQKPGRITFK